MRTANRRTVVLAGCVVLLGAGCVWGQDWPQWRGPHRDAKVSGFTAPPTWPKELTQGWKVTVGLGDSTPALVGDRLYVFARQGDEEVAMCLSADDGKELWRDKHPAPAVTGGPAQHSGPRATPTVADGKVLWMDTAKYGRFGTMVDAGAVLFALPVSDLIAIEPGREKYVELARYKVAQEQVYAFPIISGNRIYVKDKDSLTLWTLD